MQCTITGLYSYPVKSCRGTAVDSIEISSGGVAGDRGLMVLRDGEMVNQKEFPQLARIEVLRISADEFEFRCKGRDSLRHPVLRSGETREASLYFDKFDGIRQGDALNQWLSAATGTELEVVALAKPLRRNVPIEQLAGLDGGTHGGLADVAPVLLTSESSLADLNARMDDSIPMDRFRTNIVVEGLEAWAEDEIASFQTGSIKLLRQALCERCAVTCTDQLTGERSGQPLKTLRTFRKIENGYSGGILFGTYMSVEGQGTVSVGDVLDC